MNTDEHTEGWGEGGAGWKTCTTSYAAAPHVQAWKPAPQEMLVLIGGSLNTPSPQPSPEGRGRKTRPYYAAAPHVRAWEPAPQEMLVLIGGSLNTPSPQPSPEGRGRKTRP